MYRALEDQLRRTGGAQGFQDLRALAADFIRQHPDDYVPFLMDEEFESEDVEAELLKYCAKVGALVRGHGCGWGGAGWAGGWVERGRGRATGALGRALLLGCGGAARRRPAHAGQRAA
jgi:hypothetical protein